MITTQLSQNAILSHSTPKTASTASDLTANNPSPWPTWPIVEDRDTLSCEHLLSCRAVALLVIHITAMVLVVQEVNGELSPPKWLITLEEDTSMQYKYANKPLHRHIWDLFWYGTSQTIMHYDNEQNFYSKISLYSLKNDESQVSRKHITTQWNIRDAKQLLMITWCRDHIILRI